MKFELIGNNTSEIRVNWVKEQLKIIPDGCTILDAGAGERVFKPFRSHLEYVSQDFGQYTGGDINGSETWNNEGLDIISDITSIPVEDNSFDYILCTEVLEHVPDAPEVIKEFSRILKPGGILLATAPFCSLTHFAPYHFSGYNSFWWQHHLSRNNFKIELIESNGNWFSFVAQELRRSRWMGKTNGMPILGLITRILSIPIILMLSIMDYFDNDSKSLLCFGFMTRSKKVL